MVNVVSPNNCCVLVEWLEGRNPEAQTQPREVILWWRPSVLLKNEETPRLFLNVFKRWSGVLHTYCHLTTLLHICIVFRKKLF